MPLTGGDINKIPPDQAAAPVFGPAPAATCTITAAEPQRVRDGPSCPAASAASSPGRTHASYHHHPRGRHPRRATPAAASSRSAQRLTGPGRRPGPAPRAPLQTTIIKTPCDLASDLGQPRSRSGRPQARIGRTWRYRSGSCSAAAPGWRSRRSWARGAVVRRPGTVLAVTEAGQITGFNPAGPLDQTIPDLATQAPATGRTGSAACGSKRTPPATPACPARSAWTFYAADSASWPRDDRPQARQERQSSRPLPRPGPAPSQRPCPGPGRPPGTPCARRHGGSPPSDGPCVCQHAAPAAVTSRDQP